MPPQRRRRKARRWLRAKIEWRYGSSRLIEGSAGHRTATRLLSFPLFPSQLLRVPSSLKSRHSIQCFWDGRPFSLLFIISVSVHCLIVRISPQSLRLFFGRGRHIYTSPDPFTNSALPFSRAPLLSLFSSPPAPLARASYIIACVRPHSGGRPVVRPLPRQATRDSPFASPSRATYLPCSCRISPWI